MAKNQENVLKKIMAPGILEVRNLLLQEVLPEPQFNDDSLRILEKRYLLKSPDSGEIIETPKEFLARIAAGVTNIARYQKDEGLRLEVMRRYYTMMATLDFLPNSPTLMNAGKRDGQLSACFTVPVPDSLKGIMKAVSDVALIHQTGGGTGMDFSDLRPAGDPVHATAGVSSGPVSFMKIFDATTEQIKAGGARRGANMGILRCDHPDILEFIKCKDDKVSLSNFNISVAVTDIFMKAVDQDEEYDLVNPHSKEVVGTLPAREVWNLLVEHAHKTGDPGIIFIDKINKDNPLKGEAHKIRATNPCVVGDTWVMSEEGPRQVNDLLKNNNARYINGKLYSSTNFFSSGIKKVFRLMTKEGWSLDLTADHKVMTDRGWVKAEELKSSDKIVLHEHSNISWDGFGDRNDGYLAGLLFGDGTIKKETAVISVWGEDTGVRSHISKLLNSSGYHNDERKESRFKSIELRKMIESLDSLDKSISPAMEMTSSSFYEGFIAGLFDADGHIEGSQDKGISIRLSQSDYNFLTGVQRMLGRLGIISKIYPAKEAGMTTLPNGKGGMAEYATKKQYRLVISSHNVERFIQRIQLMDSKKVNKLNTLISAMKEKFYSKKAYATFVELKEIGEQEVYDVTVDVAHAFDANGLYISNCGEQPLEPYEACNLGSINLANFINNDSKVIDFTRLGKVVDTSTRFLNDVVDASIFPLPDIAAKVAANRKIGLGVMGFADILVDMEIPYGTKQSQKLARKIMKFITDTGVKTSHELAERDGSFPSWDESTWKDRDYAMRNATITTIAPTGTISMLANGTSSGVEPLFSLAFVKTVMDNQKFYYVHPGLAELLEKGEITTEQFETVKQTGRLSDKLLKEFPHLVTAYDVTAEEHVEMQSAFQEFTHNAVSKTVNLLRDASVETVNTVYRLAYQSSCKGITIYRDGSKEGQVLTSGSSGEKKPAVAASVEEPIARKPLRVDRGESLDGKTIKIRTGCGSLYVTISVDADGNPLEVFCRLGKSGGCSSANMEVYGRLISGWLRSGMPVDDLTKQLRGISCSNPAFIQGGRTLSCADAVGIVLERYENGQFGRPAASAVHVVEDDDPIDVNTQVSFSKVALKGGSCPECGGPMEYEGGCAVCKICAHSKCG